MHAALCRLDLFELLECIARCGVDKYRSIAQLHLGDKVGAMISNLVGDRTEAQIMNAATYIRAPRFVPSPVPQGQVGLDDHNEFLATWELLPLNTLPGFPLWEGGVFEVLYTHRAQLRSIFGAYAASNPLEGSALDMDADEFRDFAIECALATDEYGVETMVGEFITANAGSNGQRQYYPLPAPLPLTPSHALPRSCCHAPALTRVCTLSPRASSHAPAPSHALTDTVLIFHEFLTMLVRISFFRANPHYGMRKGDDRKVTKNVNQKNADTFGDEVPLPGCLSVMLTTRVLPNARTQQDAVDFVEKTFHLPEVQDALATHRQPLSTLYEMVSAGRPYLQLDQWVGALSSRLLLSDIVVDGHVVRLTEPQAKAAFYASAATPTAGLLPDELAACVARCGCAKYKHVTQMTSGVKVAGFVANLLDKGDEEDVVRGKVK